MRGMDAERQRGKEKKKERNKRTTVNESLPAVQTD